MHQLSVLRLEWRSDNSAIAVIDTVPPLLQVLRTDPISQEIQSERFALRGAAPGTSMLRAVGISGASDTLPSGNVPPKELQRVVRVTLPLRQLTVTARRDTVSELRAILDVRILDTSGARLFGIPCSSQNSSEIAPGEVLPVPTQSLCILTNYANTRWLQHWAGSLTR